MTEQQLLVKAKIEVDEEKVKERQELTASKSPTELSQISSLSDLPIPAPIENLLKTKHEPTSPTPPPREKWKKEDLYESIPSSLKSELIVRSKEVAMDLDELSERQALIRTQTPVQLSEIHCVADIPVPSCVKNIGNRKKPDRINTEVAEPSTTSEPVSIYASIPASLKTELVVKTVVEDPEVQYKRAEVVKSQSVHELSQINSLSDFPVPAALENIVKKGHGPIERKKKFKEMNDASSAHETRSLGGNIYATLPKSLKSELVVRSKVEDPQVQEERKKLTESKSVSELAAITRLSEIPIPANIEKLIGKASATTAADNHGSVESPRPESRSARQVVGDIYASLPRSLKDQVIVRTKTEEDEELLRQRQEIVATKSPAELSQIHNLAEIPIPGRIETWLQGSTLVQDTERPTVDESDMGSAFPKSKKELSEAFYRKFPSLDQPCRVRSKVEDPDVLIKRQQLSQSQSIHELSKIRNLNEIPFPGNVVRLPDVPLPSLPGVKSILKYMTRSPQDQQEQDVGTSYHSYRHQENDTASTAQTEEDGVFHSISVGEDSPMTSRDNESGYEVISHPRLSPAFQVEEPQTAGVEHHDTGLHLDTTPQNDMDQDSATDVFGLADQIKGTPERSLRSKKKKNRRSHDVSDDVSVTASSVTDVDTPPALPPKRLSPKKGMSLESQPSLDEDVDIEPIPVKEPAVTSLQEMSVSPPLPPKRDRKPSGSVEPREMEQLTSEERIQSRPLPPPPAPPRNKARSSSREADYTETEVFHTVADTLNTSHTLMADETQHGLADSDDLTLADSVVDSMASCMDDTLVGDNEHLETCADTMTCAEMTEFYSDDDNPYPSVDFNSAMSGGAAILEQDSPGLVRDKF